MHTNPIAHWGSGEVPLYIWAPGDDLAIDITTPQLPNAQIFYDTVAALVAAGVPAPTHLHPCQEAAGSGTILDVAGNGADLALTGNALQSQRTPRLWDPVAKNFHGYYRRAVESERNVKTAGFVCADNSKGDPGAGSMAAFLVVRNFDYQTVFSLLSSKRANATAGWEIYCSAGVATMEAETTAGVQRQASTYAGSNISNGAVVALFLYFNRTLNQARGWSNTRGWGALQDWSAMGAIGIATAENMQFFGGRGATSPRNSGAAQILYHGLWYGADAETMAAGWDATYKATLSPVWSQVAPPLSGENDSPNHNLCNYMGYVGANWAQSVVGLDPLTGLCVGDFGSSGVGLLQLDYPWRYDPLISRPSKLVRAFQSRGTSSRNLHSDRLDDATWIKSNVTVSVVWADMVDSPSGFRTARKLTATADAGYVSDTGTTTVAREYTLDFFHRRGDAMGGDVAGRLIAYNITGGAEIASVAFSAGALWQRTHLEFVAPAASTAMRIEITTNGEVIHVSRAVFYEYGYEECALQYDASSAADNYTEYKVMPSAAEALDPDSGEIEIRCRRYSNVNAPAGNEKHIFNAKTTQETASNNFNRREIYVDDAGQIVARVYNSTGVVVATMTSAPIDMTAETLVRLRWSQGGLPSGNTIELIINTDAPIAGLGVGWTSSLTVATYSFGSDASNVSTNYFGGSISYVKIWGSPQAPAP